MRLLLAPLVVLLVGCGASGPGPIGAVDGARLPQGEYVVDGPPAPFDEGDRVEISFTDDGLAFTTGCNGHQSDSATWTDGVLSADGFAATEMGCPGDGNEEDAWLASFLSSSPTIAVDGTDVRLATDDAELWLVPADEVAPPEGEDRPLEGARWRLTGIEERDGDAVGMLVVPPRLGAWLEVGDGEIRFATGCNTGGGEVALVGGTLRLRSTGITQVGCAGAGAELEGRQVPVLMAGQVGWEVTGDQLRLTRGHTTLLYTADPARG
jgi:heat shock protein HslJ